MRRFQVIVLAASVLAACSSPDEAVDTRREVQASVMTVEETTVPVAATRPGSVASDQQAKIASRLMGYVRGLDVKVGQNVKQGQLLFSIDPTDINSQVSQAEAQAAQARAALADAELDLERFTKLYEQESIPKRQLEKIKLQHQVAQENLSAAEAGLRQAKAQKTYADVRAPFDGVVVQKMAVPGDLAAPGNPLLVLENPSLASIQVDVSGAVFNTLSIGDKAQVQFEGDSRVYEVEVKQLVSAANPMTRTHVVKLGLPEGKFVNSGTFARVYISLGERKAILVPASALVTRAGIEGVFVVDEQGSSHFRMVRKGLERDEQVEIQAGLMVGDKVVVASAQTLMNGDKVVAQESAHE